MRPVPGLYRALVSQALKEELTKVTSAGLFKLVDSVDPAEAPRVLSRYVADRLFAALKAVPKDPGVEGQIEIVNELLEWLQARSAKGAVDSGDTIASPTQQLLALMEPPPSGLADPKPPERPSIPLDASALLVNGPRDLSVGPEIQKELASADRVDLLISFLKWKGLRVLRRNLAEFLERRPDGLRVLTTTYMGVTDPRVLRELDEMGARIKVSYDNRRTRLHAKAWLFQRDSGFSTAIIGSSNVSAQALLDGLEWNVRLSAQDNPHIVERFEAVFEQYWQEGEFEALDPVKFEAAIKAQSKESRNELLSHIDVRPYPFQQAILDQLAHERARGHNRNLVVAATGTGKTIMAALDFRRLRKELGDPTLLFVAHRKEILEQSRATFGIVMRDGNFGELLVGGKRPEVGKHVFASIQSLHSKTLEGVGPEDFDVVIVDEFHHAKAPTYEALLRHLKPKILLGLTATPERADGKSVFEWFDDRMAAELRLWNALEQELLCPFQYFGIPDGVDLRGIAWKRGRYLESDLENVYTGNDVRVKAVLRGLYDYVDDPQSMRALGFCVGIQHADYMAKKFNEADIPSAALTSQTSDEERDALLRRLESGDLKALFTVDIFNEGVDVPQIDTVLFLRPTQSATVYLQQLGRGLRHADGKECLTVLDFVGHARREFRFDKLLRAIVRGTRRELERSIKEGFPTLPPGCSIVLEKTAQEIILENIRQAVGSKWRLLVEDLSGIQGEVSLRAFLNSTELDLEDLYAGQDKGWTKLRRDAGKLKGAPPKSEKPFSRALSRLLHVNDHARLSGWAELLRTGDIPNRLDANDPQHRLILMLGAVLDYGTLVSEQPKLLEDFWLNDALREEAIELLALLADRGRRATKPHDLPFASPMLIHGDYQLVEIMAALGVITEKGKVLRPQQGVYWAKKHECDIFFITLEKSEKDYSPTTLYKDYPISPILFHWQSQSVTRENSRDGQRYVHHEERGSTVTLFVRERKKDSRGQTMPYTFLGPATYVRHVGERPMSITWKLKHPMPYDLYEEMKLAAG